MITPTEYQRWSAAKMSERDLQDSVLALAKAFGLLAYHTHDSRRSEPGFPDLVIVSPATGRLIYRELKRAAGKCTADQIKWLAALQVGGHDARVWRPVDLITGEIRDELQQLTREA